MIPVKKIVLSLCLILLGASVLSGCTKDEVLDQYNNIVQSAGSIALTGNSSLQGTKEKGIDDYTGSYTANYEDFSDTEYLFGGTSIKREAGKDLSIDCALEVTEGTAKVFWISGADEAVTLIETTGTYSDTITLPDAGNYIGIECENFTGFPSYSYVLAVGYMRFAHVGFPIQTSPDHGIFAPPRSLSQLITSFIGS